MDERDLLMRLMGIRSLLKTNRPSDALDMIRRLIATIDPDRSKQDEITGKSKHPNGESK